MSSEVMGSCTMEDNVFFVASIPASRLAQPTSDMLLSSLTWSGDDQGEFRPSAKEKGARNKEVCIPEQMWRTVPSQNTKFASYTAISTSPSS